MHIKLNGDCYPIFIDEEACDVVDQLIFAADEAGYTPPNDQPVGEWAEDAALVILARYTAIPSSNTLFDPKGATQ